MTPEPRNRRAELSGAIGSLMAREYGKGPTRVRTFFNDDVVMVMMEDGLLPSEERMVTAGQENAVREYRLRFQEIITAEICGEVERITGCRVLTYHSQIAFTPTRVWEVFQMDRAPEA